MRGDPATFCLEIFWKAANNHAYTGCQSFTFKCEHLNKEIKSLRYVAQASCAWADEI